VRDVLLWGLGVCVVVATLSCNRRFVAAVPPSIPPAQDAAASTLDAAHPAHDVAPSGADARSETRSDAGSIASDATRETVPRDAPSPDADAAVPRDAGMDGALGDIATSSPRTLTQVLSGGPWMTFQWTPGMAVDEQDRVYLEDKTNVYMIDGQTVSTYLTFAEATAKTNLAKPTQIIDLDRGPDGLLYLLVGGSDDKDLYAGNSVPSVVVRSGAAHVADLWQDASNLTFAKRITVEGAGSVAILSDEGLTMLSDAGSHVLYTSYQLHRLFECAWEHIVAAPSGVFLQLPGCNEGTLWRGNLDGSGVGLLYDGDQFKAPTSQYKPNFVCSARDPSGGFYFVLGRLLDNQGSHLYHVTETASGADGLTLIATVPTFLEASKTQNETFAFDFCSLAAAPDGTVFYATYSQLWKVSP
jgi:hypothetical protein